MSHVLIIESNDDLRLLYTELLALGGHSSQYVAQLIDLRELLLEREFDIVVASFDFHNGDSFKYMSALKSNFSIIPILAIVPCYLEYRELLCIFRNVVLLEKPFLTQAFTSVIERVL